MTVVIPCDATETRKATHAIHNLVGPTYLRLNRQAIPLVWENEDECAFKIGKAFTLKKGKDVGILASGYTVWLALQVAREAEKKGISIEVLDIHTIKPIDREALINCAKKTGALVTVEEHSVIGGLRSAVTEIIAEDYPVPVKSIGIQDRFGESALGYDELLHAYGISKDTIMKKVLLALYSKK
jgi:transketolase